MASPTSAFNPFLAAAIPGFSTFPGGGDGMIPVGLSTNPSISSEYHPTSPVSPIPSVFSSTQGLALRPSRYQGAAELHASTSHTQHYQTPSFRKYVTGLVFVMIWFLLLADFIYRSSHFNPAHFLSNEFQPEIWTPDVEGSKNPREDSHKHM